MSEFICLFQHPSSSQGQKTGVITGMESFDVANGFENGGNLPDRIQS